MLNYKPRGDTKQIAYGRREQTVKSGLFLDPILVKNYNNEAKLLFGDYRASPDTWNGKIYLWGTNGFVKL